MQYTKKIKNENGLTLVELIMVLTLIGILSAILVSIINPQRQRDYAEDGVSRANLTKACAAIEAFYEAENQVYPLEGTANNPLDGSVDPISDTLSFYLKVWPTGFVYNRDASGSAFSIHVPLAGTTNYYKCTSTWKNTRECGSTTDLNVIDACD